MRQFFLCLVCFLVSFQIPAYCLISEAYGIKLPYIQNTSDNQTIDSEYQTDKPMTFADYQKMISDEFEDSFSNAAIKFSKCKVIVFNNQNYAIKGSFQKGMSKIGSLLSIYKGTDTADLILQGIVTDTSGEYTIKGTQFNEDGSKTYGEFILSNCSGAFSTTPKKADNFEIKTKSVRFHCGRFGNCDAILAMSPDSSTVVIDGLSGKSSYAFLEAPVSNATIGWIGYLDFQNLLRTAGSGKKIVYENGDYFVGAARVVENQDDTSSSVVLIYGRYECANGESFEGTFSDGKYELGVYCWPNGDRFEGKVNGKKVYGAHIEGKTFFHDGTVEEGNWPQKYNISQKKTIYIADYSPSTIKQAIIRNVVDESFIFYIPKENPYSLPDEHYSEEVTYFNPEEEHLCDMTSLRSMSYSKKRNLFVFCNNSFNLALRLDKYNRHIYEGYYEEGKLKYITVFEWYSNGNIMSIRSYKNNKEIYLSCDFFSDGTLKSAKKYDTGNNGQNIIRMWKRYDSEYNWYTVDLFDLNGHFEKKTKWEIGQEERGLWGASVYPMAPNKFDFSSWKKTDYCESRYSDFLFKIGAR